MTNDKHITSFTKPCSIPNIYQLRSQITPPKKKYSAASGVVLGVVLDLQEKNTSVNMKCDLLS